MYKPEGGRPFDIHQDAAYMGWVQPVWNWTCWIALDDTYADGGTLVYVRGSHKWGSQPTPGTQIIAKDMDSWTDYVGQFAPEGEEVYATAHLMDASGQQAFVCRLVEEVVDHLHGVHQSRFQQAQHRIGLMIVGGHPEEPDLALTDVGGWSSPQQGDCPLPTAANNLQEGYARQRWSAHVPGGRVWGVWRLFRGEGVMVGRWRVLVVLVVSAVVAAACAGGEDSEPAMLSLGYPFPADHPLRVQVLDPWAEDVWEATGNTVGVEFHPEQALSTAAETYANVASGGQDMGWALQGYSPGRFPATDVVEMPLVFGSASAATAALWALYEEFEALRGEYSDVKVLGLWTTGPGDLWLVDGTASSVADIAGLTLRSPGPVQASVIRALGAVPVNMAAPDLRAAIDAGEIDGLLTVDTALATHNLVDVIASGTECRCYVLAAFLVMNLDTWNSLSPDQQTAVDDLSARTLSDAAAGFYDRAGITAAQRNADAGIVKILLDDDQLDEWKQATRSVVDDWVGNNTGFDARAMYERMLELAAG